MRRSTVLLVLAAVAFGPVACGDDDATTTTAPTVTSTPTSDTSVPGTSTDDVAVDTSTAVFPTAASDVRFDDPVAAATAFATDYAGFVDPVVGEYQGGDARSGEVEVRPSADGPVTTVFVRMLGPDDDWWVLGSATANIVLTTPGLEDPITSPVDLVGSASAYEGTVLVEIREDGNDEPLGTGYVTGGSTEMGPFEGSVTFDDPAEPYGALVLFTQSQEGTGAGGTQEIGVLRIRFGS
jgi:hypothetical protein